LDITSVDKDVPVVRISYRSSHPHKAAAVANAIAQNYIQDYIHLKYESADMTSDFLQNQIGQIAGQLSQSEEKIEQYRVDNNIINIRQETETDLRKISQLKIQQTSLRMSLDAIIELNEYLRAGQLNFLELAPNYEAFTDLLSTEMIKKIKELQAEKKDLLLTYTLSDERVQVVDRKIKDYTSYLRESVQNTMKNLKTKYAALSNDIEAAEQVFEGLPERERLLTIMDREFSLYQSSYIFLNNKKIEADIAKAAKSSFHRILQPATVSPTPVAPNGTIITIVATLMGLLGGLVFIVLLHYWRPKVRNLKAIETRSAITVAYTVPYLKTVAQQSRFFTKTAISLQVKQILAPHTVVCFTAHTGREGRAFQVRQLAAQLAQQGHTIAIADVADDFTNTPLPDGAELVRVPSANLTVATETLERLRQQYDLVLINNENLHDHSVALLYMSLADGNIFVLDSLRSKLDVVEQYSLLAEEHGLSASYFVFNREGYEPGALHRIKRILRGNRPQKTAA
jgi:capsular polysaccharide biosynthesis protein